MTVGERITTCRLQLGMSQETLSEKAGVHRNAVLGYEKNRIEPSLFSATCIADALGVSLDYLAGRTDKKFINK